MMKNTATVKIFLAEGDPDSIRTAEISNWSGKAVAGPRSHLDLILGRDEAGKPGVYFLAGVNPETGRPTVYVGEAEVIKTRIKGHLDRDSWKTLVFFVSKDENLTKAHIKYLEGKLIEIAKAAGRFDVENANASGSRLPESDAADMDVFLVKIEQLLPVLGQDFLKPFAKPFSDGARRDIWTTQTKNVKATGRQTENGFLVFKDSEAVLEERPSSKKYPYAAKLRNELMDEGVLQKTADRLIFAKNYEFTSPSAAASVIHGGHTNGLIVWKDKKGVTLKEKEQDQMANKVSEATSGSAPGAPPEAPHG
jgi:predicted type IV restriction endonuclease